MDPPTSLGLPNETLNRHPTSETQDDALSVLPSLGRGVRGSERSRWDYKTFSHHLDTRIEEDL